MRGFRSSERGGCGGMTVAVEVATRAIVMIDVPDG
jgi:hypothetical protein